MSSLPNIKNKLNRLIKALQYKYLSQKKSFNKRKNNSSY